jgi:hypothetical protein
MAPVVNELMLHFIINLPSFLSTSLIIMQWILLVSFSSLAYLLTEAPPASKVDRKA